MSTAPQLTDRRKWTVLAICCLSLLVVSLDNTIVNVALPSISRNLHATVPDLQWIVDAYTLVLASLLISSGALADRVGRRRILQIGLAVFGAGSLLCSLAFNVETLIAFRVLQAVGGSMLNPVALSIISHTFTDRGQRARAMGFWSAVVGISMALGPVVGGVLVASAGWRSIFWVNVPVVLVAIALTVRFVPESRAPRPRHVDLVGQALVVLLLASLTFGIIEGSRAGWNAPRIIVAFAIALAALIAFLLCERRQPEPLVDLRFFRNPPFSGATVIAACAFASLGGFLFLNTVYLQDARGLSALEAGVRTLPMAILTIIVAPISGRVVAGRGLRIPIVTGGIAIAASAGILSSLTSATSYWLLLPAYILFGAGFGMLNAPISTAAVSGMPISQVGVAAAIASASRQVGQTLGVATIGAFVISAAASADRARIAANSHPGWWIILACGVCIAATGLAITSSRAHRAAEAIRQTLTEYRA